MKNIYGILMVFVLLFAVNCSFAQPKKTGSTETKESGKLSLENLGVKESEAKETMERIEMERPAPEPAKSFSESAKETIESLPVGYSKEQKAPTLEVEIELDECDRLYDYSGLID